MPPVVLRPLRPADQPAARALILAGLAEHFGALDPTMNPDLDDLAASYVARGACFLVADDAGQIVGTGALTAEAPGVGRIVRMSVRRDRRRGGLGRALVAALLAEARVRGDAAVLVETNRDWHAAIGLYERCGFRKVARDAECVHLSYTIS